MSTLIDLTLALQDTPSEATDVKITELSHRDGAFELGLVPQDFPGGMAISNETITLTTHTGTHMDAPLHYGPTSGGQPAKSIDEVPLEWCFGSGVRLDLRHVPAGDGITVEHLGAALAAAEHELLPGDIVLLWTGADRLWGSREYLTSFSGLTGEGTRYLVERGVKVIGIDAWGLDRPMLQMVGEYRRTGDGQALWPSHLYGRETEYLQLEKLGHLAELPGATGFQISCFPIPIKRAGAGWTRVVAIVPDAPTPR